MKHLNQKDEMLKLLESFDWSSSNNEFILPTLILKEEYKKAEKLMSTFGKEKPFDEEAYRTWPIFLEFRNTPYFLRAFKNIYEKDFFPTITDKESEEIKKLKLTENQ